MIMAPSRVPAMAGSKRRITSPATTIMTPPAPMFETANHAPSGPSCSFPMSEPIQPPTAPCTSETLM